MPLPSLAKARRRSRHVDARIASVPIVTPKLAPVTFASVAVVVA